MTAPGEAGRTDEVSEASQMTSERFRQMPVPEMVQWISLHGDIADPRNDVDTESLKRRFSRLTSVQTVDVTIDTPRGQLPGRAYTDSGSSPTGRGLVWAHGGAFLGGGLDMPESNWVALELAARGIPVLAIDYTKCLGGIHYPVPSDDVLAWWDAAVHNSVEWLGVDGAELVIGGASAGATLTASAVRRMIDAARPVPAGLVLVYPAVHPDSTDPAVIKPTAPHLLGLSMNYAGSEAALADPQVFAGLGNGRGFPSTLIVACERDAFVPSAESFHRTLSAAGVSASLRIELDADHGHIDDPSDQSAHRTIAAMADWILHG